MDNDFYREYQFKFYLNANHFIIIDGKEGKRHPHTWEFTASIAIDKQQFVQFNAYEQEVEKFLNQYQNKVMNDIPPFDRIIPTLENMAEYFVIEIEKIVARLGGKLMKLESSETPTRSYIISLETQQNYMEHMKKNSEKKIDEILDGVIDKMLL